MIDIASFTRLRTDRQTYHSARRDLKASLTWLILRQQNRCQCMYGLVARSSCQTGKAKTAFLHGSTVWKWLSVRNFSLRLLVPPVKRRKGPLPFKHSSCQTKTRQEFERLAPSSLPSVAFFFQIQVWTSRQDCVQKKHKWENPCV